MSRLRSLGRRTTHKSTKQADLSTWEKAKEDSLRVKYPKQLSEIESSLKKPNPSCWIRKFKDSDFIAVSWRVKNKPVYFDEEMKEDDGWIEVENIKQAKEILAVLAEEIEAGEHDEAIKEAFHRPSKENASEEEA